VYYSEILRTVKAIEVIGISARDQGFFRRYLCII